MTNPTSLGQNRHFRRFWLGQAVSNFGDAFSFVAMPLMVFEATHSVVQMGNVTAIGSAGQVMAALFAGVLVDRAHRRRVMIGCDLLRLLLLGSMPLLAAFGMLHLAIIYVVALLTAMASNVFLVAYMAAVANLVEPHEVAAANGRLQATRALSYVLGSALAGAVSSHFGVASAMGVDSLSFAASAITLLQIRFRRDRAERDPNEAASPIRAVVSGLKFLVRNSTLRALTLVQTLVALLGSMGVGAAVIDLLVYRLKVDFEESSAVVGTSLALASLGAVIGALSAGRLGPRLGLGGVCLGGTALQGLGLLFSGFARGPALVTLGGVFWSAGLTCRAVAQSSLRQTLTPDGLLGRVLATGWTLIFGASAIGAVLVTRVGAAVGVAHATAMLGGSLIVVAFVATFSPLARATTGSAD